MLRHFTPVIGDIIIGVAVSILGAVIALNNDALTNAISVPIRKALEQIGEDTPYDATLRQEITEFVGANGEEFSADVTLPNLVSFDDFPLILKNSGEFQDTGDANVLLGYNDAELFGNGGEDLLVGYGSAVLHGGEDDDLFYLNSQSEGLGEEGNDVIITLDRSVGDGGEGDDLVFAANTSTAKGDAGNDVLLGFLPQFIKAGERIGPPQAEGQEDFRPVAEQDYRLTLDGGTGDDYVIALGGTGAITVGGEGRDFLFNTSEFGEIYGDTLDGLDSDGNPLDHTSSENADTFWFWPGTFIQDAQPNDRITLFGIPLVGGSNAVGGVAVGDGSAALDFFSFGTYYTAGTSGQLAITNLFARYLDIGPEGLEGVQIVENYDFGGFSDESYGRAAPGDLGLTFRIFLPLDRALEALTISLFNAVWGSVFAIKDAAEQLAKLNLFFFIPPQPSRKYCN